MKRATVTTPDDLERAVEAYMRDLEVPPALTAVMQITLREYFSARGYPASEAPGDALVPSSGASQPAPEIRGKTSEEKRAAQFVRMFLICTWKGRSLAWTLGISRASSSSSARRR
jgi:hypothetical protein